MLSVGTVIDCALSIDAARRYRSLLVCVFCLCFLCFYSKQHQHLTSLTRSRKWTSRLVCITGHALRISLALSPMPYMRKALLRIAVGIMVIGGSIGLQRSIVSLDREHDREQVHTVSTVVVPETTTSVAPATTTTLPPTTSTTRARRVQRPAPAPAAYGEVEALILATWPPSEGARAVRVARCESGLNPRATNGSHWGVFQISKRWHQARAERMGYTWEQVATQAGPNIAVAHALWLDQGWRPWTCKG